MVYEGDFVRRYIARERAADAGLFAFPAIDGSERSIVVGGDVAALFTNNDASQQLVHFLATVEAARVWVRSGGVSPNRRLDPRAYPNLTNRRLARSLIDAKATRFDLSDLVPPAFGATPTQGMAKILQDYLRGALDIDGATHELQAAVRTAAYCERALDGVC
jgi:alpha-glucoside transport system substrate-binding protein